MLISCSQTIPLFLQDGLDEDVLFKNRICALEFLRTFSETSGLEMQETCILTWGQIAL